MKSFTPTPGVSTSRAFLASLLTCIILVAPLTPVGFASTNASRLAQTRSKSADKQQPPPTPGARSQGDGQKEPPVAATIAASDITATKTDAIANDTLNDGKAQGGDTINYTITVRNNSATDTATGVVLNDTIDPNTTIVDGSLHAQPQARNDAYTTVGNTLLEAGLASPSGNPAVTSTVKVFDNDTAATDPSTLVSFDATTPNSGTVTLNPDGSFSYLPAPGFTGTDTFTYTVSNSAVPSLTDTATVTITVSNRVWYVNNAAAAGGDGRSSSPFQTLAPVNGAGGAGDSDAAGDYIYLFTGNAAYTTGLTLEADQFFIGNGVALVVGSHTLRAAGTRPTLSNGAGNALTLAVNTNTQGLNLTAASNAAIFGSGISGAAVNVSDVNVSTTGTGTGVSLTNQAAPFNYSGGGTGSAISGNSSGTAVLISGGNANITFSGTPISQNSGRAIDIQTRTGGTVSFNNGSTVTQTAGSTDAVVLRNNTGGSVINFSNNVNLTTNAGRGLYTDNSTGSFTLNMNAANNNISATGGAAIDVEDIAADLAFVNLTSTNSVAAGGSSGVRISNLSNTPAGRSVTVTGTTTVSNSAGTGVLINSNAAAISFATLNSAPAAGQIGLLADSNSGTVSSTGGTITTSDAIAVSVLNSPLNMTLASVSTDNTGDSDPGVSLNGLTGTLTMNGGALTGGNAQGFLANGQNGNITYNGTISQANAFRVIEVTNKTGGTVNFGGAVSSTSGTGTGVLLNANGNTTINFTGGLALTTNANPAFTATGGGTVNVCDESPCNPNATGALVNTLTTTTGTALNVANTNIGLNELEFRSISSNGAANGIVLNNTGTTNAFGGLTVSGNSSGQCGGAVSLTTPVTIITVPNAVDCTGGTIQNSTGAGILLTSTRNVSLTRMRIINGQNDGIFGTSVTNFTLASSLVDNNGDAVEEAGLDFANLHGASSITNSTVRLSHENNIEVRNNANNGSQATLTVTGSAITNDSTNIQSDDGILYESKLTANMSINVSGSVFSANRGDHLQAAANDASTLNAVFTNNNLSGGHATALGQDIVVNAAALSSGATITYDINGNTINGAILSAITTNLGVPSTGATMSGRIRNNIIGTTGVIRSCSQQANGIAIDLHGAGTHTAAVTGNTMRQCGVRGINVTANDSIGGNLFLTVQSNTVLEGGPVDPVSMAGSRQAFNLQAGSTATDTNFVCLQLGGAGALANNFNKGTEAGNEDIRVGKQSTANVTVRLPGYAGGANDTTAIANFIKANNTSSEDGVVTVTVSASGAGGFVGGAACALPAGAFAEEADSSSLASAQPVANSDPVVSQLQTSNVSQPDAPRFIVTQAQSAPVKPATQTATTGVAPAAKETTKQAAKAKTPDVQAAASAFPVALGDIGPGESVTVIFSVKIADALPQSQTQITNQGQITGTNFAGTVLTDDPDGGGANDPTITPVLTAPNIAINSASVAEPASGTAPMAFTVSLQHAYGAPVSVNYQTADGTATAGTDYTAASGTLTFSPGETLRTVVVDVLADGDAAETDETFTLQLLETPVNGYLGMVTTATGTITTANPPGTVLISEVRTSGPGGTNDDFVELYNNTDASIDIGNFALVKSGSNCGVAPVVVAVIPVGTMLPARGHYLIAGSAYSLTALAAADQTLLATDDIEADRNLALFDTATAANFSTGTRRDAVGFAGNNTGDCALLLEGTTLSAAGGSTSEYSFARKLTSGLPKDTNDNTADFMLVSTTPALPVGSNTTPILGAPGTENLASPIQRNAAVKASLINGTVATTAPPNRVRSSFGANSTNAAFGTLSIQRRFKNTLDEPVTRLRFRIVDLTTINNRQAGQADLRVLTSTGAVTNSANVVVVTVNGLTLEAPPQSNGGGLNSTLSVDLQGGGLAPGSSIDVQFLLGVQEQGAFSFFVNVEALPGLDPNANQATRTTKANTTAKQRRSADTGGEAKPEQQ
ncbi:MAG TPA: Calx-beta domain-containing protein [Pyrinomonadaceae bacterium]|nr:Calx-beta domain-containing protein [Pyrinomonadaceae bacterium]